jgi:predicted metal-binding membrane protein
MKALAHRDVFLPAVGALIVLAWLTLVLWESSPYGRYLKHAELSGLDLAGDPWPALAQASAYVTGWTLMTVAMMLPTALPLVETFRRFTSDRADRGTLVLMLILGYLAVWTAFGIGAHVFDWGLHELYEQSAWLQAHPWIFSAGVLFAAGIFQFSAFKYRCLDECRSPLGFVVRYWGRAGKRFHAFVLGAYHGAFCVGCCWALMLLMFAIGIGSVGWMLVIGAVMAIEKNMPWGKKISVPLGVVLLAWSGLIVLDSSWTW